MKRTFLFILTVAIVGLTFIPTATFGQASNNNQRGGPVTTTSTTSKITYHNGPVLTGASDVYVIWYGCWSQSCGNADSFDTQLIVSEFLSTLGFSPYFQINSTYPDSSGVAPSGGLLYGGAEVDPFHSHGVELTSDDIQGIISDLVLGSRLPLDPAGVYLVLASPNVAAGAVGFCSAVNTPPHHGIGVVLGTSFRYGFVGDPRRCPSLEAPQFVASDGMTLLPTPNANLAADAMASNIAHVLSTIVTDPFGGAWYDRYGLENADKCQNTFGQTFTTANGARANIHLGSRDYLIQQNWVNDRKGRCAMSQ